MGCGVPVTAHLHRGREEEGRAGGVWGVGRAGQGARWRRQGKVGVHGWMAEAGRGRGLWASGGAPDNADLRVGLGRRQGRAGVKRDAGVHEHGAEAGQVGGVKGCHIAGAGGRCRAGQERKGTQGPVEVRS